MSQPDVQEDLPDPEDEVDAARAARVKAAAERALAEAAARRATAVSLDLPKEEGGREGPEPVRFGDWEKKGIAYDF
ncbi:MAG: DUF1674 domain-containing protein [Pseudomonadota bacterium]